MEKGDRIKIGIVGLGYVGIVTAAVLAHQGNSIIGVDIDEKRVSLFKSQKSPIYEEGLDKMLNDNASRMEFSTDYSVLKAAEAIFVSVQTPNKNGKLDASFVMDAASRIKDINKDAVLVLKSTILPGTARSVANATGMKVAFNPEFTKEGTAIKDTLEQDRVVIGSDYPDAIETVERIWSFTKAPVVKTTLENAEMIKYAANAFLATKISFINEFANLVEKIPGGDIDVVAKAIGLDKRIAPYFLKSGIGYGGSCFPKDSVAITAFAKENNEQLSIVESAMKVNDTRVGRIVSKIKSKAPEGSRVGVLGLAFKAGTNDLRESKPLGLIEALSGQGYVVFAYDSNAKPEIAGRICDSKEECIGSSDIIIIATEAEEFKNIEGLMGDKLVIDIHRMLDRKKVKNIMQVGVGSE